MLSIRLCQILSEKIFHDFAGTIGVIDNSVRLIKSNNPQEHTIHENVIQKKAINLVQTSASKLIERLRFYRYLYSIPSDKNTIDIVEVNKLGINFLKLKSSNIQLIFQELTSTSIPDNISKIIMCFIFIASELLKKDGTIKIDLKMDNNFINIKIMVIGKQLNVYEDKIDILLGKGDINKVEIGNIHEYYTHYLITECGYKLEINHVASSIEYVLTCI